MKKEIQLWQFIAKRLRTDQRVMLLLVADSAGSSPGRQGFKMAIGMGGEMTGSIGGGIMEVKLVELAKVRLNGAHDGILIKKQVHKKSATRFQSGMICSGEQTVVFIPLRHVHLKTVREIIRCLKQYQPALLKVSTLPGSQSLQVFPGQQNESAFHLVMAATQTDALAPEMSESAFCYEENLGFINSLYIIGGGHCALALSELMAKMDFYLCLIDDRPDLSTLGKNRFVHEKHIIANYEHIGDLIPSGPNTYVIAMTLGYRSDEIVLRQLLGKDLKYLGMLGSDTKVETLLNKLAAENYPASTLAKIHAPVGLSINSRTPEEIAVSIAGEIIAVKNGARL